MTINKKRAKAIDRKMKIKKSTAMRHAEKTTGKVTKVVTAKGKVRERVEVKAGVARATRSRTPAIKANIFPSEEVTAALERLIVNDSAVAYLKKNVSKRVLDVLGLLDSPKTDEDIAAKLDMKINAVRRILNMMQDYGITNYYVSKNVNGWLSFAWYVNVSKFPPFFDYISGLEAKTTIINDQCNDYFMCNECYEQNKLIFTFDSAFEEGFKCISCSGGLTLINKDDASKLISVQTAQS